MALKTANLWWQGNSAKASWESELDDIDKFLQSFGLR